MWPTSGRPVAPEIDRLAVFGHAARHADVEGLRALPRRRTDMTACALHQAIVTAVPDADTISMLLITS